MLPFALLCAGVLLFGLVESTVHSMRIRRIPIRIHVNGTRGKSTVTRLIAAGLRAGGHRVIAKTTGTAPNIILEDGSEMPVRRRGRANISEQIRVAAFASRRGADALVLECMALEPENQWVSEHRIVRSTIGVITNVREDHLDVMGPTVSDVARALALTVPRRGHLVTAETDHLDVIEACARRVGATVHRADPSSIPEDVNGAFEYVSFRENVACAVCACELAGVPREVALGGMLEARGDPGVMHIRRITRPTGAYVLAAAFAANDRASNSAIWKLLRERGLVGERARPVAVVMNNRGDRLPRIGELAPLIAEEIRPVRVFLTGQAGRVASRCLNAAGLADDVICDLTAVRDPEQILSEIEQRLPGGAFLLGLGNTKTMGQVIADYFERNGEPL
ncbi:MAG: poly-gamma-glutamate synthase PgsB [Firmicutes bacterium]|jgi:poly-gamma-glutamate synthase PgsB/CapB|nr:poly-gamma-glutamate synthase PgsB [Bacillota bacterium]